MGVRPGEPGTGTGAGPQEPEPLDFATAELIARELQGGRPPSRMEVPLPVLPAAEPVPEVEAAPEAPPAPEVMAALPEPKTAPPAQNTPETGGADGHRPAPPSNVIAFRRRAAPLLPEPTPPPNTPGGARISPEQRVNEPPKGDTATARQRRPEPIVVTSPPVQRRVVAPLPQRQPYAVERACQPLPQDGVSVGPEARRIFHGLGIRLPDRNSTHAQEAFA